MRESITLTTTIQENWEDKVKEHWQANREKSLSELRREFGDLNFNNKLANFIEIGPAPFWIVSYHNAFFHQARASFILGAYYPALTGASALGERVLNHLVLELREQYKHTPTYKKVYRKKTLDDRNRAIDALAEWGVLRDEVANQFRSLASLRHRSIHFNPATYGSVKQDALEAIKYINKIIELQFASVGNLPWFIFGTKGACFIKRQYETEPFVKSFYLPRCPFVTPYYALKPWSAGTWLLFDRADSAPEGSDQAFCEALNSRTSETLAPDDLPPGEGIKLMLLTPTEALECMVADKSADGTRTPLQP
jgi:hypothetical protein